MNYSRTFFSVLTTLLAFSIVTHAKDKKKEYEFLDERLVEHTFLLDRKVTPITKFIDKPILKNINGSCGVIKGNDGLIRMWYVGREAIPGEPPHGGKIPLGERTIRYAESKDGLNWTLPELDIVDFRGNKNHNILIKKESVDKNGKKLSHGKRGMESPCVALTENTPGAKGKYTMFDRKVGFSFSDDGLTWTVYDKHPLYPLRGSDTYNNFFFDKRIGKYVMYHRPKPGLHAGWSRVNRLIARVESTDLINWDWDNARCVMDTDGRDAPAIPAKIKYLKSKGKYVTAQATGRRGRDVQVEQMTVTPYKDMYLGFAGLFDNTKNGKYQTYLVHSYDGINWIREPVDSPFIPLSDFNKWDSGIVGAVTAGCPINVGDKLIFYYLGSNMTHGYKLMTNDKLESRNLGAGYIKKGRFVGYHADNIRGELLTRPFVLNGKNITLNANAPSGKIRVAISAADGKAIKGYGKDDFIVVSGDQLALPLKLKGKDDLSELTGKKIRLRIEVDNGAIYGFSIN